MIRMEELPAISFRKDREAMVSELEAELLSTQTLIEELTSRVESLEKDYISDYVFHVRKRVYNNALKCDVIKWALSLFRDHERSILYVHLDVVNRICNYRHRQEHEVSRQEFVLAEIKALSYILSVITKRP